MLLDLFRKSGWYPDFDVDNTILIDILDFFTEFVYLKD